MLLVDTLVVIGAAAVSLGTVQEIDGIMQHDFWLRNSGDTEVILRQGYTSCGCTTIEFCKDTAIMPGDSSMVTMRFNPRGKSGEFVETATIAYGEHRKHLTLEMSGTCVASEETLARQFPIRVSDSVRLSADRFDLGIMSAGERKERAVVVLHTDEGNRREIINIPFVADEKNQKGLQHVKQGIVITDKGKEVKKDITFDVVIK